MIMILASRWDTTAQDCADAWADQPVGIMTARDLTRAGWCRSLGHPNGALRHDADFGRDCAMIDGRSIADEEIRGVLTPPALGHGR